MKPLPLKTEEYGQTISLAIEGRHYMEPASWKIIFYQYSIPTFLLVMQSTFVVLPDNIF